MVFPTKPGADPMVAVPLVLLMGWVNSPPAFSTGTETIADVANERLRSASYQPPPHHLDDMAEAATAPAGANSAPPLIDNNRSSAPPHWPTI